VKTVEIEPSGAWPTDGRPGVLPHLVVNRAFLSPHTKGYSPDIHEAVEGEFRAMWARQNIRNSLHFNERGGLVQVDSEVDLKMAKHIRNSV
jgi:hypothetical protein